MIKKTELRLVINPTITLDIDKKPKGRIRMRPVFFLYFTDPPFLLSSLLWMSYSVSSTNMS